MKRLFSGALAALLLSFAAPVSAQDHSAEHHGKSAWKELDAFHTLLAASWHPAAKDDFKPIRAKADSLAAAARSWSESKAPTACETKEIKDAIASVMTGSAKVAELVRGSATDADIKAALHDVHERFEVVEKGCKPEKAHH